MMVVLIFVKFTIRPVENDDSIPWSAVACSVMLSARGYVTSDVTMILPFLNIDTQYYKIRYNV